MRQQTASLVSVTLPASLIAGTAVFYTPSDSDTVARVLSHNAHLHAGDHPLVVDFVDAVAGGDPRLHFYLRSRADMRYLHEEPARESGFRRHTFVTKKEQTVTMVLPDCVRMYCFCKSDFTAAEVAERPDFERAQYVATGRAFAEFVPRNCPAWRSQSGTVAKWESVYAVIPPRLLDDALYWFIKHSVITASDSVGRIEGIPMTWLSGLDYLNREVAPPPIAIKGTAAPVTQTGLAAKSGHPTGSPVRQRAAV